MKTTGKLMGSLLLLAAIAFGITAVPSYAAIMKDYCVVPPYASTGVKPNLVIMLDNSASMFDLAHIDKGSATRPATYCYDNTYKDSENYDGYFLSKNEEPSGSRVYYEYTGGSFTVYAGAFPASCTKRRADVLCVDIDATPRVTRFIARGNFLNWLAASKFDVQKSVLTGGKYVDKICSMSTSSAQIVACTIDDDCPSYTATDGITVITETCNNDVTNFLMAESRGCVGRPFIKEVLTADFVEYTPANADANSDGRDDNDTNVSLGIAFTANGPLDSDNLTAVSRGGQTYIEVFLGDYNQYACQRAVDQVLDPEAQKNDVINAIGGCIGYDATNKPTCQRDGTIECDPRDSYEESDCLVGGGGACSVINDGVCSLGSDGRCPAVNDGICATVGTCTANNGTCPSQKKCVGGANKGEDCTKSSDCPGSTCSRICSGGGKAGAECNNDNACEISTCTAGNVGFNCTENPAICNIDICTAGDPAKVAGKQVCTNNTACNSPSVCTAGKVGQPCTSDAQCNSANACTAGKIGNPCVQDTDCNSAGGKCTAPTQKVDSPCTVNRDCDDYRGPCLSPTTTQIRSTFAQSMHSCYAYLKKGQDIGENEVQQVSNPAGCSQIYKEYYLCSGGAKDGLACSSHDECGTGVCQRGPGVIRSTSPVYLCSLIYAGYCAFSDDGWETTTWVAREYSSADDCIKAKYEEYCGGLEFPPVVDPTDDASATEFSGNLPAILGGASIEGQLGTRIGEKLTNQLIQATEPRGVLQSYAPIIRFGLLSFNYNGSPSECSTDPTEISNGSKVACPKKCQDSGNVCSTYVDCADGEACIYDTNNFDGGLIRHYLGSPGICSTTTGTSCSLDTDCSSGETCLLAGNHNFGLVAAVDRTPAEAWTPFSEGFYNIIGYYTQNTTMRLNNADFETNAENSDNANPVQYVCQGNNVLLISDGLSTTDQTSAVMDFVDTATPNVGERTLTASGDLTTRPRYFGSKNLDDLAYYGQTAVLENPDFSGTHIEPISTYVVYSGVPCTAKACSVTTTTACTTDADCPSEEVCVKCTTTDEAIPEKMMQLTASRGGGAYYYVRNKSDLQRDLENTFGGVIKRAAAGTAASVLASGAGEGANLIQAVFYPGKRYLDGTGSRREINWIGRLSNLWYFVDARYKASSIYEDDESKGTLNLADDNRITFRYDTAAEQTVVDRMQGTTALTTIPFESLSTLWEAGLALWNRDLASAPRTIYTPLLTDATQVGTTGLMLFTDSLAVTGNVDALQPLLQATSQVEAQNVIKYTHGWDLDINTAAGLRHRSRSILIDGATKVWKLGDIINSTPKIAGKVQLNSYDSYYEDKSYTAFIGNSPAGDIYRYKSRGMVFAGSNDGMLHAFNLGNVTPVTTGGNEKATITGTDLGKELWAFIPKNALPYLKFMADPSYCHTFTVDLNTEVIDMSIGGVATDTRPDDGSTWRTVLVGGMRFGGACKTKVCSATATTECAVDSDCPAGETCQAPCTNCVGTPILDPEDSSKGVGFSSYFALDITDNLYDKSNPPKFLWEFTHPDLGFSTSGPAVVRVGGSSKNGKWIVVFGSGPTGPIEATSRQFLGRSDQTLKFFAFDVSTGPGTDNSNVTVIVPDDGVSDIANAFAGSMAGATLDTPNPTSQKLDYQDNALYVPYVKKSSSGTWTDGGIVRIITKQDTDPANWRWSVLVDGIGPMTAGLARLLKTAGCRTEYPPEDIALPTPHFEGCLWLFGGTGRYYFKKPEAMDDPNTRRTVFGLKDPCYDSIKKNLLCSFTVDVDDLTNVTDIDDVESETEANQADFVGWKIDLGTCSDLSGTAVGDCDDEDAELKMERNITNTVATNDGVVFFTTYRPYTNRCSLGGKSYIWATRYNTGGAPSTALLKGEALLQVSTGSIEQKRLSEAFTEEGGRKTAAMEGQPPMAGGLVILSSPQPKKRVIHVRER